MVVEGIPLDVQHVAPVARHSGVMGVHFARLREKRMMMVTQAKHSRPIYIEPIEPLMCIAANVSYLEF